jgi:tryptophan-rich sensory protein
MKKLSYIIIPLIALATALSGSLLTSRGMSWYKTINLPDWTPPGSVIGIIWTVIFILAAISAIIVWNEAERNKKFKWTIALFIVNIFLNIGWSLVFFFQHQIGTAVMDALALWLSVLLLVLYIRIIAHQQGKTSLYWSYIALLPYLVWVTFASYLTYTVWLLNK